MELRNHKIGVVGGGIGGLATAFAFARTGAQVTLFEQADAFREIGAGLQLSPNGIRVLRALGLEAGLGRAPRARGVHLHDHRGRSVTRLDLERLPPDWSYRFVHRADLIGLLAQQAEGAGVNLMLDARVEDIASGPRPTLIAGGEEHAFDLIVAADGLHSALRSELNGGGAPRFTRQVAWRATVPNTGNHPNEAQVHMGPGRHLVSYPLRGGDLVNLVAVEERESWTEEGWQYEDAPDNLRAAFSVYEGPVPALLERVEEVHLWGLFKHPVARRWFGAGVVLLGDAAHPTLPFLAQGANMALEDAWMLVAAFEQADSMAGALALYAAQRRPRVSKVLAAADGNAWKFHIRNPVIRQLAHMGLRGVGAVSPDTLLRQYDWLYGYDVTAA